ncbi:hypothetical protein V6N13_007613 [Hibiscus sabdariffa]
MWVILETVSLVAWNDNFFISIAKRWGSVIMMDEETLKKNMFDQSRILISASQTMSVSPMANIFVNNVRYCIKISLAAYEDQRCWIDGGIPNSNLGEPPEYQVDEVARCHFDDVDSIFNEEMTRLFPNNMGNKNNHSFANKVPNKDIEGGIHSLLSNSNVGPTQNDQHTNSKCASEVYVNIPITFESESPRNSSRCN